MNEPENFLSRWSRRKHEATEAAPDAADETQRGSTPPESAHPRESGDPGQGSPASRSEIAAREKDKPAKTPQPEFDLSQLPPLESITAESDIRAFLAPGVPSALTRAALRRAWVADPKIRDFIEIAEYQWDFNAPGIPGFDLSPPTGDIARMVSEILGGIQADESAPEASAASMKNDPEVEAPSDTSLPAPASHRIVNEPSAEEENVVSVPRQEPPAALPIAEREQDVAALQNDDAPQNGEEPRRRRGHGRAMPR